MDLINEEIDTVYTPNTEAFRATWHKKETVAGDRIELDGSNIPLVFSPIIECGADIKLPDGMEVTEEMAAELAKWKIIAADCRNGKSGKIHPLHVPKDGYAIHQNELLFDTMIAAAREVLGDAFEIATVGTLDSYKQFFVSISVKGQSEFETGELEGKVRDKWNQFFNLFSSHNSMISSRIMLSVIRIVCMNTVQMSVSDSEASGTSTKIKHSKNSLDLITPQKFAADLKAWTVEREAFKAQMLALKAQPMNLDGFRAFATGVHTMDSTDMLTTTSKNRIDDLSSYFVRGRGNAGVSELDAFNAFTEFYTSGNGVGKNATPVQRIAKANFGQANNWKRKALAILSDRKEFKVAIERGSRLWEERLKHDAGKMIATN